MVSLYFHIPFCEKKCPYCHFYVIPDDERFKPLLSDGLSLEWKQKLPNIIDQKIASIYFGGGTPSRLGAKAIGDILDMIAKTHSIDDIEITLEANPECTQMHEFAKVGINRASFGVQSFDPALLKILGRNHTAEQAIQTVQQTKESGISNITIDLMFDVPHQTLNSWQASLNQAAELPITHLSLYNLTIEPHTAFFKNQQKLKPHIPSNEISLKMYRAAQDTLTLAGFEQYEISAFAKQGCISNHNTGYWTARPFLGLGPSAFSYYDGKRFRNVANLNRYLSALKDDTSPVDFSEELNPEDKINELLAVNLRLLSGVNLEQFQQKRGTLPQQTQEAIASLTSLGLLQFNAPTLKMTDRGILLYDSIAQEII